MKLIRKESLEDKRIKKDKRSIYFIIKLIMVSIADSCERENDFAKSGLPEDLKFLFDEILIIVWRVDNIFDLSKYAIWSPKYIQTKENLDRYGALKRIWYLLAKNPWIQVDFIDSFNNESTTEEILVALDKLKSLLNGSTESSQN